MAFTELPPASFAQLSTDERDVLDKITGLAIFNVDTGTPEIWLYERWAPVVMGFGVPNTGDALTWDAMQGFYVPTPTNNPLLSSLRVYNDGTNIVQVKRIYKSLALTNTSGLTTATMTPGGVHTLTGSTNTSYRITVDSAGTTDWQDATFKWSENGGTSFPYEAVSVATGSTGHKTLVPITLSNGVTVLFTAGNFVNGDRWDFIAIAASNQLYDLNVDTTNSIVQVGTTLQVVDANFGLDFSAANVPRINLDTNSFIRYQRSGSTLYFISTAFAEVFLQGGAATADCYFSTELVPLAMRGISTPTTPASTRGLIYGKGSPVVPYWLDSGGVESIIPQAAKAETITGAWTFSTAIVSATITTLASTTATITTMAGNVNFTGTPTFGGATFTTATVTTLTAPTIAGATTASGAWTFSAAATAVTVTNNLLASSLIATNMVSNNYFDSGLTQRILLATSAPHVTLTGTVSLATVSSAVTFSGVATFAVATTLNNSAATPSTPGSGIGKLYTYGAGAAKPRWLDNSGTESLLGQLQKPETVTGGWMFDGIKDFTGVVRITLEPSAASPQITLTGDISHLSGFLDRATQALPSAPAASTLREFGFAKATGAYQDTPRWLDSASHDSGPVMRALTLMPVPTAPITTASTAAAISTTLGFTGLVTVPCGISVASISFNIVAAGVGVVGATRFAIYTESGSLITGTNITDAIPIATTGKRTIAFGAAVYLPAGQYYFFICTGTAYSVTDPQIATYTQSGMAPTFNAGTIFMGTVVCTAGAAPSPLGTITAVTSRTPVFLLNGAAT